MPIPAMLTTDSRATLGLASKALGETHLASQLPGI